MGFSRQEYWSGLPFPSPGDLPNPWFKPRSPALQADSLPSGHQGTLLMGLNRMSRNKSLHLWSLNLWHPGMWSQVGLRKHHYEQAWWRSWNASWAISNPKRWCCEVLHSICQQIWKTQQWPQDWKRSVFIPIPKKGNAKECSNYHTVALISHTS